MAMRPNARSTIAERGEAVALGAVAPGGFDWLIHGDVPSSQ